MGELIVEDAYGEHAVKLPAGDMILYPASSLHRVAPITRGSRWAAFFWAQSMVRADAQRSLLYDLDNTIQALSLKVGQGDPAVVRLPGTNNNLLRMWADVRRRPRDTPGRRRLLRNQRNTISRQQPATHPDGVHSP